jgi:hypothetical protein
MSVIYLGRDNRIVWELRADGQTVTPGSVTRAVLWLPATASTESEAIVMDSQTDPDIELTDSATRVQISAGDRPLKPGTHQAYLTVYDAANPDGLAWSTDMIKVIGWRPDGE